MRTITDDYEQLEPESQQILLYLLDRHGITRKEAAELLKLGKSKTFEILANLPDIGLIERKGKGRGTYYRLVKN